MILHPIRPLLRLHRHAAPLKQSAVSSTQPEGHSQQLAPAPQPPTSQPAHINQTPIKPSNGNNHASLLSAEEWSFSQEDILVKKCLLSPRFRPITISEKTPDPNKLPYIAAPGSSKGLVISGSDAGLQNMMIDPTTGTISIKPRHLPTLRLLDFPTFLSLMFRAIDMATKQNSIVADRAAKAVRVLLRDLTRLYESLKWANEPQETWWWVAFLRWTHMIQTRELLTGFNAEQAFLVEARNRRQGPKRYPHSQSNSTSATTLIHASNRATSSSTSSGPLSNPKPTSNFSHWFICPCCGSQNDHFSPNCPSQAKGPKPIPKYIQEATRKSINDAPITTAARNNLIRMASALYAKLDKSL